MGDLDKSLPMVVMLMLCRCCSDVTGRPGEHDCDSCVRVRGRGSAASRHSRRALLQAALLAK